MWEQLYKYRVHLVNSQFIESCYSQIIIRSFTVRRNVTEPVTLTSDAQNDSSGVLCVPTLGQSEP